MLLQPSAATLRKYGLSLQDWQEIADHQGGVCAVCRQLTSTGRLCIDHEHVRGWKKMPPHERKLYVRGLLCWRCNTTFVGRGITAERSRNVTVYLESFEAHLASAKSVTNQQLPPPIK